MGAGVAEDLEKKNPWFQKLAMCGSQNQGGPYLILFDQLLKEINEEKTFMGCPWGIWVPEKFSLHLVSLIVD